MADRLSPRVLTGLVDDIGRQAAEFLAALPPHEEAHWPVSWAGEGKSENWMDVSRDYAFFWPTVLWVEYPALTLVPGVLFGAALWWARRAGCRTRGLPPAAGLWGLYAAYEGIIR